MDDREVRKLGYAISEWTKSIAAAQKRLVKSKNKTVKALEDWGRELKKYLTSVDEVGKAALNKLTDLDARIPPSERQAYETQLNELQALVNQCKRLIDATSKESLLK